MPNFRQITVDEKYLPGGVSTWYTILDQCSASRCGNLIFEDDITLTRYFTRKLATLAHIASLVSSDHLICLFNAFDLSSGLKEGETPIRPDRSPGLRQGYRWSTLGIYISTSQLAARLAEVFRGILYNASKLYTKVDMPDKYTIFEGDSYFVNKAFHGQDSLIAMFFKGKIGGHVYTATPSLVQHIGVTSTWRNRFSRTKDFEYVESYPDDSHGW